MNFFKKGKCDNRVIQKAARRVGQYVVKAIVLLPAVLVCLPVFLLVTGAVADAAELSSRLSPLLSEESGFIRWKIVPDYPTFAHYGKLLFMTPQFFILFWNSVKMTFGILAGQLLVGVPAAWAFAVYQARGGRMLFGLYVVLMLLPFQVLMLSDYLVLHDLGMLNTQGAVVIPAVFATMPVFITYGGFRGIPVQLIEAARIDGAGEWRIFCMIGLPLGKSGIMSAMVLGFLEYWNMMEQPMAFLEDKALWPLSLYLPQITWEQAGAAFAASVIMLIPSVFVFLWGQEHLEQGIIYSGLKE